LDTAGCNDNRCVVVGVPNEATPTTFKCRLGAAVSFVDQPALIAGLAAVGRVDLDERHPAGLSLIAQERAELSERPRMQRGPLGLAKPYPRTDPRQLFDGDTAPGALRLGHDAFGDLMIDVGREAGLFTGFVGHADHNAAIVIAARGVGLFLSSRRADDVFLACNRFPRLS
jgi:hypothetical protein